MRGFSNAQAHLPRKVSIKESHVKAEKCTKDLGISSYWLRIKLVSVPDARLAQITYPSQILRELCLVVQERLAQDDQSNEVPKTAIRAFMFRKNLVNSRSVAGFEFSS